MKEEIKKDFERANLLGVNSFPTMLVQIEGKATIVARGYAKAKQVNDTIEKLLAN